jgi:hypothetical protein
VARTARTSQGAEVTDDLQPTPDWTVLFIGHVIRLAWSVVAATLAVCFWDITTRHAAGPGRKEFGRRRPRAREVPNYVFYCYLRVSARTRTVFPSARRAQIFDGKVHGRVGLRVA